MKEKTRVMVVVGVVVVLIAGALGLALLVTGGDDGPSGGDTSVAATTVGSEPESATTAGETVTTTGTAPGVGETAPVTITGDELAQHDPAENPDATIGLTAPVVDGTSFDGSAQSIGGPGDGPTMLVFLAHWCPHCNDEIPELIELEESGDMPEDLNIIGISTAVAEDRENYPPSEWIVDTGWLWPVLVDSAASEAFIAYGGTGFPYTTMLDADGSVLARKTGASSAELILQWINDALS